ncbi:Dom-3 Z [Haplosporangium bisporale]|nr:Dom-3 Z [Haplosporangium bisporale]
MATTRRIRDTKAIHTRSRTIRRRSTISLDNHFQGLHSSFPVQPLDRFKVKCAPFRQPVEIGSFSYDEQRNFIMDDSQLKYYYPPDLSKPNNLSVNYDKYIARDPMVDEHIDALLDALICIKDKEEESESSSQDPSGGTNSGKDPHPQQQHRASMTRADFVCYRGILTKIMCTPYTRNEPWELGATLYKGSIYIEEHVTEEKRKIAGGSGERHKLMSYWGYRFETICNISKPVSELQRVKTRKRASPDVSSLSLARKALVTESLVSQRHKESVTEDTRLPQGASIEKSSDTGSATKPIAEEEKESDEEFEQVDQVDLNDPELLARLDGIVDTNLQYCTVARTKIGQNSIIMGAEVDCTSEPKKPSPHNPLSSYIELKTSRVISNPREQSNFEKHKLLKFWAQSFLPGIPTIIVGFRDDDGNVVHVQTFKTMEIPRLVRGKEGSWDTTICINFLDGVLSFLKRLVVKDDPSLTYTIRWAYPFQAIEVKFAGPKSSFLTTRFLDRWERGDPSK